MPLVNESLNAKVDRAEANAQFLCNFTLREIRTAFKKTQNPEIHILALLSDFATGNRNDR